MKNKPLLAIFLVIFFDLLGFGVVIPILPYYAKDFGSSAFVLGWMMAIYSITQFLFSPFWGSLSDFYGRKKILLISILGGAFALFFMGMAHSIQQLFFSRMLAGLFAANISTASAYIADNTSIENRAKGMGIIGAGFGLGFIFGPVLGGLLAPHGYHVPILTASILGFFNFCFCSFILKEPKLDFQVRSKNRRRLSLDFIKIAFSQKNIALPIILFFLATLAFSQLEMCFAWFVLQRFQYQARAAGMLLGLMGIIMVMIQGGAIGRLVKKYGEKKLVFISFCLMATGMLGAGAANSPQVFIIFLLFIATSIGITNPSLSSALSKTAPPEHIGGIMGVYQSGGTLARIIGPPLAGFLFQSIGIAWPIYTSAIIMAMTALFVYSTWLQQKI